MIPKRKLNLKITTSTVVNWVRVILCKMSRKYVNNYRGDVYFTPNEKVHIKDEPISPNEEFEDGNYNRLDLDYAENDFESCAKMRKSMSMNDLANFNKNVNVEYERNDSYPRQRRPSGQQQELQQSKTKFVSMAEAIYHFQRDTPNRFHSTRPQTFRSSGAIDRLPLTRPHSPVLRCKGRSRPQHIMTQQEKEELELEEIRKFKIKAQPIPKSVLDGNIHLPEVQRKPITVPEPFNLTEMHKKLIEPEQVPNFKARPAPKHILEKPFVPVKPPPLVTQPVSPNFRLKKTKSQDLLKPEKPANKHTEKIDKPCIRTGPVRPEPFSFEKRDEELKRRKEERIKRQIEEDKKQASLFKAQPLPGGVKKRMTNVVAKISSSSASSDNKENHVKFEAKPATVLYKEPFKPVLQIHYVKPAPFKLTTEKRAADRELFDKQLKKKEEEQEIIRQQREKEQRELEEKIQAELRAKAIHHAKPAPAITPFVPERSVIPLTVPETPKFVRRLNQR